jgi:hypothetical protein
MTADNVFTTAMVSFSKLRSITESVRSLAVYCIYLMP